MNVDEVSVTVSGGMGESDIGAPRHEPRSRAQGGNSFRGQAFYNNAGDWSRGEQHRPTSCAAARAFSETPGIIKALRHERVLRRAGQARPAVVLWQLSAG